MQLKQEFIRTCNQLGLEDWVYSSKLPSTT